MAPQSWSDQAIEILVGKLLRAGVSLAAFVVFAGAIVYLAQHGSSPTNYRVFRSEPADLRSISGIAVDIFQRPDVGIIQFGLLLLIATPVARVVLSIVGFAEERDHLYTTLTSIVLIILLYSLLLSA